jgi:hypothetical protein
VNTQKCPHCQEGWQHPSAERPGRLVCNICGRYDGELPKALHVWLVPSEEVLDQPGSWLIRKWDMQPFVEGTKYTREVAARIEFEDVIQWARYSMNATVTAARVADAILKAIGDTSGFAPSEKVPSVDGSSTCPVGETCEWTPSGCLHRLRGICKGSALSESGVRVPQPVWDEILDFITDRVDIKDGADGPVPNAAMSLLNQIQEEVK